MRLDPDPLTWHSGTKRAPTALARALQRR